MRRMKKPPDERFSGSNYINWVVDIQKRGILLSNKIQSAPNSSHSILIEN